MPDLIVQAKPGDVFICRNAGNIAPPYSDVNGGVTATIEYAVAALNVSHIIVCGHSDCGAMKALLHPEKLQGLPSVRSWLHHAARAEVVVRENHPELDDAARLDALIEENVLAQLDNLRTHPCVASRLKSGSLSLHGWVYDIESGQIRVSTNQSAFLPMSQIDSERTGEGAPCMTVIRNCSRHRPLVTDNASAVHAPPTPDDVPFFQRLMFFLNPIDGRYEDLQARRLAAERPPRLHRRPDRRDGRHPARDGLRDGLRPPPRTGHRRRRGRRHGRRAVGRLEVSGVRADRRVHPGDRRDHGEVRPSACWCSCR